MLPEVHFVYTTFREWAVLPSLGDCDCLICFRMKVPSKTPNAINTFNKLRLVVFFTFTLWRGMWFCLSPAAEFNIQVTWSTADLFAFFTDMSHSEHGTQLICLHRLHNVFSILDAAYNQLVFIRYRLKSHQKRRMHPVCLYVLPILSSSTRCNAISLFPSVT
jgi:hypothetical protein